jgi:hypothetical protein
MKHPHRLTLLLLPGLVLGCGSQNDGQSTFGDPMFNSTGGAGGGGGSKDSGASGSLKDALGDGSSLIVTSSPETGPGQILLEDGDVCTGQLASVTAVPFDMFIMLDQSTSMDEKLVLSSSTTRWQAVSKAIVDFVNSPDASALGVGIGYFGVPQPGGGIGAATSCDPAVYAIPDVEIGPLSSPAVVTALTNSIGAHKPSSVTPTGPAVDGALRHAKDWAMKKADPNRPTVVVLATDGFPSYCEPSDTQVIADTIVAPALTTDPKIRTFVIAAGNDSGLSTLSAVSRAGGTGMPVIVTDSADTAKQVTDALLRISRTDLACSYKIPPPDGGEVDPGLINVKFTPTGQAPIVLSYVKSGSLCSTSSGGFFYDEPNHPTKVYLCESTCNSLFNGQLEIIMGCRQPVTTN